MCTMYVPPYRKTLSKLHQAPSSAPGVVLHVIQPTSSDSEDSRRDSESGRVNALRVRNTGAHQRSDARYNHYPGGAEPPISTHGHVTTPPPPHHHNARGCDSQENDLRKSSVNDPLYHNPDRRHDNRQSVGSFVRAQGHTKHSTARGHSQDLSKHPGDKSHLKYDPPVESDKKMTSPVTREIGRPDNTLSVKGPSPVTHVRQHTGVKSSHYHHTKNMGITATPAPNEWVACPPAAKQLKAQQHFPLESGLLPPLSNEIDPTRLPGNFAPPGIKDGRVTGQQAPLSSSGLGASDHVILETARLVATCTAAATAAVLSARDAPVSPSR